MKNRLIIIFSLVAFLASCTDRFEEFNQDIKNPSVVSGEALFTHGEKALVDQVSSTSVNLNVFKLFAQYWTETTYTDEANYDIVNRTIADNTFQQYYVGNDASKDGGILMDFRRAAELISAAPAPAGSDPAVEAKIKANKLAIIELLTAYSYQNLVDIFGNVPYSKALDIENLHPAYDDAATIYQDLINRVTTAVNNMDENYASFGTADLIYGGDVLKWIRFGNSLRIKLGITLADVNPQLSKATVEAAVAGGRIFTSNEDNAELQYLAAIHTNPIYVDVVQSGRDDFIPANTIVDMMNELNDPRRRFYFTLTDTSTVAGVTKLAYSGGIYGESNPFSQYSHIGQDIISPDFPGILLTYDEVLFYLAEAAARGYAVAGTPQQFYNTAVTSSILWWGGTAAEAAAYLATPGVAYTSAGSGATWQEKIATQEYIAFYTRGLEGWTTWRRLDYPRFEIAPTIDTEDEIPTRFTYPINEQTLNAANYNAAASAVGGDELTTKIFWDVN